MGHEVDGHKLLGSVQMKPPMIKPPIVIVDAGDLMIFRDLEQAEKYLEPIDVSSGALAVYDSEGRLLQGTIVSWGRRVKLEPAENDPQHASEVRRALTDFLSAIGEHQKPLETLSLEGLIETGLSRLAIAKKRGPRK